MKPFTKIMLRWIAVYVLIGLALWVLNISWQPVMDAYHDASARQIIIWITMGALFVSWALLCWYDGRSEDPLNNPVELKPAPPKPVGLVLGYVGDKGQCMAMPVIDVTHAQSLLELMNTTYGVVINKQTKEVLYVTDIYGTLVLA